MQTHQDQLFFEAVYSALAAVIHEALGSFKTRQEIDVQVACLLLDSVAVPGYVVVSLPVFAPVFVHRCVLIVVFVFECICCKATITLICKSLPLLCQVLDGIDVTTAAQTMTCRSQLLS